MSRNQGVLCRAALMNRVFPFTGTKTKEGVVQSVTSGKSTALIRDVEICDVLLDLLIRPSVLPMEGLWVTPLIYVTFHVMNGGCLPGAMVQGPAFAVHMDGRKYLISRACQKDLTNVTWQTRMIHSNSDISQCQECCPACREDLLASDPVGPKLVFGRLLSGSQSQGP